MHRTIDGKKALMASIRRSGLDGTDIAILCALQTDARTSTAELARAVHLSPSATADRIRRLTDLGAIRGYRAAIDHAVLGYAITAFVRLRYATGNHKPFHDLVASTPEIVEAHHVTGEDCFIAKVVARSMPDLERVAGRLARLGPITTSVVYSTPVPPRSVLRQPSDR